MPLHTEVLFYGPGARVVSPEQALVAVERICEWAEVPGGRMYFPTRWRGGPVDGPSKVHKFQSAAALQAWLKVATMRGERVPTADFDAVAPSLGVMANCADGPNL